MCFDGHIQPILADFNPIRFGNTQLVKIKQNGKRFAFNKKKNACIYYLYLYANIFTVFYSRVMLIVDIYIYMQKKVVLT